MRPILAASIGLLSLGILGGLLDAVVWPGSALALFRPQLTLALLALALLSLVLGPRRLAVVALGVAGLGAALLTPALRVPTPEPPPADAVTTRLLALNLSHRNDDVDAVSELIAREQPDILALTELTPAWERSLRAALRPYRVRAVATAQGSSGIGVLGRGGLRRPEIVDLAPGAPPSAQAVLDLAGLETRLLVAHPTGSLLPGDSRALERELSAIGRWARAQPRPTLVCGDLNAAPWMRGLRDLVASADLRVALPGGLVAGSWPALPVPLRVAIDGCLVGTGVRASAVLGPRVGSDHRPVVVELAPAQPGERAGG